MTLTSNWQRGLLLGVMALVCSRTMFALLDDPEGPNLLVVTVMATVIYVLSLTISAYNPVVKTTPRTFSLLPPSSFTGLLLVVCTEVLITIVLYFALS